MKNLLLKIYLFVFLSFLSSASFGQLCYANLEGTFIARTNPIDNFIGIYEYCADDIWNGIVRWEFTGTNGDYKVFSLDSMLIVEFEDMSMGAYYKCYQVMDQSNLPNGNLRIHLDNCNELSISGSSQWGEIYSIDEHSIDNTAKILTLKYSTDYGEMAEVELTRTDSLLWTDGTTSFSKTKLSEKQLGIFPNPVKDFLFLKTEKNLTNAQITIIDLHGKVLLQKIITSPEIDLSSFEKGIYFLEINGLENGDKWMKKLVID